MPAEIYHIVASYDIANPKRLYRIAKEMKDYGQRALKSVFECNLSKALYLEMKHKIEGIMDPIEDTVRFYFLCEKCITECEHIGKGKGFTEEEDVTII